MDMKAIVANLESFELWERAKPRSFWSNEFRRV